MKKRGISIQVCRRIPNDTGEQKLAKILAKYQKLGSGILNEFACLKRTTIIHTRASRAEISDGKPCQVKNNSTAF
jgi:hypothetical protein